MAKISNTLSYPNQSPIEGADYLIGTAANSTPIDRQTKTFTLQGIAEFVIDEAFDGCSYRLPIFTAPTSGEESFKLVNSLFYQDAATIDSKDPCEAPAGSIVYLDDGSGIGSLIVAEDVTIGKQTIANGLVNVNGGIYFASEVYDASNTVGTGEQVLVSQTDGTVEWQNYQGSGLEFQGAWNADTNTPDLQAISLIPDNTGKYWIVSVEGTTPLNTQGGGTITDWEVGDWAIISEDLNDNIFWDKIDNSSVLTGQGTPGNLAIWTTDSELGDAPVKLGAGNVSLIFNNSSIADGDYSNALGDNSIANGTASIAVGTNAQTDGNNSISVGLNTISIGNGSIAMGLSSIATGDGSVAMGGNAQTIGNRSVAMGGNALASGAYSISLGLNTAASGDSSVALGQGTQASDDNATAIGLLTIADAPGAFSLGTQTNALGNNSLAGGDGSLSDGLAAFSFGGQTQAQADFAVAMGVLTNATGDGSVALGKSTTASADYSTAMGDGTTASGIASTAMGGNTEASGDRSVAMGQNTIASGNQSFAMGANTLASGDNSTAMGQGTIASGGKSFAIGDGAEASGNASIAIGVNSEASGSQSLATGTLTEASGNYSTTMGLQTEASGDGSVAMGANTEASGNYSTALNNTTTASGAASFSSGLATEASGQSSTAMGSQTTASGNQSTAIGNQSTASGIDSSSFGKGNISSGLRSVTIGSSQEASAQDSISIGGQPNTASGIQSVSIGSGNESVGVLSYILGTGNLTDSAESTLIGISNTAFSSSQRSTGIGLDNSLTGSFAYAFGSGLEVTDFRQTVLGSYNSVVGPGSVNSWNTTDNLFIIGNGTGPGFDSNALEIRKDGELKLNTYGAGQVVGTATYNLSVDANGRVIETPDIVTPTFIMTGLINNLGSQTQGYDFMEWTSNVTSPTQIPLWRTPLPLKLKLVTWVWMGSSPLNIFAGDSIGFTIGTIPDGLSSTIGNYTPLGGQNLFILDGFDTGTYAAGQADVSSLGITIDQFTNTAVVGSEDGTVGPNDGELAICLYFEESTAGANSTITYDIENNIIGPAAGYTLTGDLDGATQTGVGGVTPYSFSTGLQLNPGYSLVTAFTSTNPSGTIPAGGGIANGVLTGEIQQDQTPGETTVCDFVFTDENSTITDTISGGAIPIATNATEFYAQHNAGLPVAAYWDFDFNNSERGLLYNQFAARQIQPPTGFRLPTSQEWTIISNVPCNDSSPNQNRYGSNPGIWAGLTDTTELGDADFNLNGYGGGALASNQVFFIEDTAREYIWTSTISQSGNWDVLRYWSVGAVDPFLNSGFDGANGAQRAAYIRFLKDV